MADTVSVSGRQHSHVEQKRRERSQCEHRRDSKAQHVSKVYECKHRETLIVPQGQAVFSDERQGRGDDGKGVCNAIVPMRLITLEGKGRR